MSNGHVPSTSQHASYSNLDYTKLIYCTYIHQPVWLALCLIVHLCVCIVAVNKLCCVFPSSPYASIINVQNAEWCSCDEAFWGHAAEKWTEGSIERGSMISHDFLDAQHMLRGRGCMMVEITRLFPVVHAMVSSIFASDGVTFEVLSSLACCFICLFGSLHCL